MWWKIYFGITILEALINVISLFAAPGVHIFTQVVLVLLFLIAILGLYGYIFKKRFLSYIFWQYFLGIYLLIDVVYLVYALAPASTFLSWLSFITIYNTDRYSLLNAIFGVVIDIPLLYALYKYARGNVYAPQKKKLKTGEVYKWGMLQTALWGYSFVLSFFLFVLAFFSSTSNANTKGHADIYSVTFITFLFAPLIFFWLWVIVAYKNYKWNWWRTTLVANAILYSGSILFGVMVPSTPQGNSGFDIVSILQLFILFLSLYVFGREQFK